MFQHTAARRRLGAVRIRLKRRIGFQHTAARRRLASYQSKPEAHLAVSTHSRPKAAGRPRPNIKPTHKFQHTAARRRLAFYKGRWVAIYCFNTQPPEGGWQPSSSVPRQINRFNTQPPEGGWPFRPDDRAGNRSFNTQPPEGGWQGIRIISHGETGVSTHSHPKAAGITAHRHHALSCVSTHSRPKAAGRPIASPNIDFRFQHTAARRRLDISNNRHP